MNSIVATFLTYRFEKKDKDKFEYLRGRAADRMAFTFIDVLDEEAKRMGKATEA